MLRVGARKAGGPRAYSATVGINPYIVTSGPAPNPNTTRVQEKMPLRWQPLRCRQFTQRATSELSARQLDVLGRLPSLTVTLTLLPLRSTVRFTSSPGDEYRSR